ncbi:hypothetical protein ALC62_06311, partial [Cyphomyrmex costatus]
SAGRNKVSVALNNHDKANSILRLDSLKANNLRASIPAFRVMRTGVAKNISLDITEENILKDFSSQAKILSVKRLQHQLLPRSLTYMHVSFPIIPYIPRFGHISSDCKSTPRCTRCGQGKHNNQEDCPRVHLPPQCVNCNQDHFPSSSKCPLYLKHKQVYQLAADKNISYMEARTRLGLSS